MSLYNGYFVVNDFDPFGLEVILKYAGTLAEKEKLKKIYERYLKNKVGANQWSKISNPNNNQTVTLKFGSSSKFSPDTTADSTIIIEPDIVPVPVEKSKDSPEGIQYISPERVLFHEYEHLLDYLENPTKYNSSSAEQKEDRAMEKENEFGREENKNPDHVTGDRPSYKNGGHSLDKNKVEQYWNRKIRERIGPLEPFRIERPTNRDFKTRPLIELPLNLQLPLEFPCR